ncbi:MAG TPA: META domain-containing protein, partial [Aeromicrobium sp.]|nr:META domain-containing protein [Aeromicrobium sp.]
SYAEFPTITAPMRAAALEPPPLPAGSEPATAQQLTGRWVPANKPDSRAFVAFEDSGTWHGSDGCNGAGGRFAVGSGGRLLTTAGITTAVACENSRLPSWVDDASRAGFTRGQLVLYDASGNELGQAVRA